MSDDLIRRSDAIKSLDNAWINGTSLLDANEAVKQLKDLPSVDRPQGEWVESFEPILVQGEVYLGTRFIHKGWSCSECGEVVGKKYSNCPYCLARMKGADDEID